MERESFEDVKVAELLNKNFVSIKVDREERPDIDSIYMNVCQMLTDGGGWPMSIFMTPEQEPFYAGTYYPKISRYNITGFIDILNELHSIWTNDREKISRASTSIVSSLNGIYSSRSSGIISCQIEKTAYELCKSNFDKKYGGLRRAPKFPTPHNITFLLRYHNLTKDNNALEMAEKTLSCICSGGIYDHIGYGFCRYSTDEMWLVPHFEKMLYDNALMMYALTEAYQLTKNPNYKRVVNETTEFVKRTFLSPEGGFYTALDADSEGVEGKYYVWTKKEILEILGEADGKLFCDSYNISDRGNFEGKNIPNLIGKDFPSQTHLSEKLLTERAKRIPPALDDKILTGLNGLMIAALSYAARVFGNEEYTALAQSAAEFILNNLQKNGRLLARYKDEAGILAYSEDYAYFIWGLIELYYTTANEHYIQAADKLNTALIDLFWDDKNFGLYLYGSDGEKLITRPKECYDGATPSANSVSAMNFIKLSILLEKEELTEYASNIINSFSGFTNNSPLGAVNLISGKMLLENIESIVLAGDESLQNYAEMKEAIFSAYTPFSVTKYSKSDSSYKTINNNATAYICKNFTCKPGVINKTDLQNILLP